MGTGPAKGRPMSEEWQATGVWDAVVIDVLRNLEYDADEVMAMSAQERIDAARAAGREGRLDARTVEMLTRVGILGPLDDPPTGR